MVVTKGISKLKEGILDRSFCSDGLSSDYKALLVGNFCDIYLVLIILIFQSRIIHTSQEH